MKLGVDPTSPDVHLGFAYVLDRLADFQHAGHTIVLIVGDYTARIGDPSGRSKERPVLPDEELDANAQFFAEQAFRILDRERTEVRFNGEWLGKLSYADTVRLARTMTVARLLERDDFANRFAEHVPISLSELLYPVMQAYDSVAIEADIEIGGTDQRFNLLAGRDVMPQYGLEPQDRDHLPAARRHRRRAEDVEVARQLHRHHRGARGDVRQDDVDPGCRAAPVVGDARRGEHPDDPMSWKLELARRITSRWHGDAGAQAGEEHFTRVVRHGEAPADVPAALPGGDDALARRPRTRRHLVLRVCVESLGARTTGRSRASAKVSLSSNAEPSASLVLDGRAA